MMKYIETSKGMDPDTQALYNITNMHTFLQNIQKNPDHYADEVRYLVQVYMNEFESVKRNPGAKNEHFHKLLDFFGHVFQFYDADLKFLSDSIQDLLKNFSDQLERDLRFKLAQSLVVLSRKGHWNEIQAVKFFLDLLSVKDKEIRGLLFKHTVQLVSKIDEHGRKSAIHRDLIDYFLTKVKEPDEKYAKNIFKILIIILKKEIWRDAKSANLISEGTFHNCPEIVSLCCRFFIENVDNDELELSSDEEQDRKNTLKKGKEAKFQLVHKKKTKSESNRFDRLRKKVKKAQGHMSNKESFNFKMIDMLYNPLALCQKILSRINPSREIERSAPKTGTKMGKLPFKIRLEMMGLISRIIWKHELIFPRYLNYFHGYLKSNLSELPEVLSCLAGCIHQRTPLTELQQVIILIRDNFANESATHEKIVMGVNTLREICIRNQNAMDEDEIYQICLLRKIKHKTVAVAVRAFINLWRVVNVKLLKKEYRGRFYNEDEDALYQETHGQASSSRSRLRGLDLLNKSRK